MQQKLNFLHRLMWGESILNLSRNGFARELFFPEASMEGQNLGF